MHNNVSVTTFVMTRPTLSLASLLVPDLVSVSGLPMMRLMLMSASRIVTLGEAETGLAWEPAAAGGLRYGGAGAAVGPAELAAS